MSNILDNKLGILDRLPSAVRMRDRDTAGGRITSQKSKEYKKKTKGHYRKNWDKDLWD